MRGHERLVPLRRANRSRALDRRFGEPRARPPLPRPGDTLDRSVESHKPFIPSRNEPAEANQQVRFGELVVPWERERQGARGRTR